LLRVFRGICVLLALAASPAFAANASACVLQDEAYRTLTPDALQAQLYIDLSACSNDPRWLAAAGRQLLAAGLHLPAVDFLERALLLDETLREAQLDYALALASAGETQSAGNLLSSLLDEPGLPAHLRGSLARTLRQLAGAVQTDQSPRRYRLAASLRAGYDSNLLGAPDLRTYSLTLGDAQYPFALPASYQAQSGNYLRSELEWGLESGSGDNRWQAWASARDRRSFAVADAGLQQASAGAEAWRGLVYANAELALAEANVGLRFRNSTLGAGLGLPVQASVWSCIAKAGMQGQLRDVTSDQVLSGKYAGVVSQILCSRGTGVQETPSVQVARSHFIDAWMAEIRVGRDLPQDPLRPGGSQNERGIRILAIGSPRSFSADEPTGGVPITSSRWLLEMDYVRRVDNQPYSPVLGRIARQLNTLAVKMEWQSSLEAAPAWRLHLGYQLVRRHANIALFGMIGHGPYVGVSRLW
jgi:hypothetical protein